ncbi:MAG: ABC transporter ATP-binding protein [Candidatus Saccharibacteria bacterium]|nr:ABC transporter ATP-binding protein [Rhodoferax sp.]
MLTKTTTDTPPADEDAPPLQLPDAQTVLHANKVEKTYGNGTHALARMSLRIQRGDFVSLLGPSGCGKSTLLKMFAGLEEPSHGHIRWAGADDPAKSGLKSAMVFQEATLMPWATVAANVRLPLDLQKVPTKEANARVATALTQVGLGTFGQVYPRELSGGMQMRASIARALVTEPDVLLMDEPFGALDEFTRNKLDTDLRALWQVKSLTVVFVTHSIYEAVFLSSRVVMMAARPGRIVADIPLNEPDRSAAYRLSAPFSEHCRDISSLLMLASETSDLH